MAGDDILQGSGGIDLLEGGSGSDILVGGAAPDILSGDAFWDGNAIYTYTGSGLYPDQSKDLDEPRTVVIDPPISVYDEDGNLVELPFSLVPRPNHRSTISAGRFDVVRDPGR